MSFTHSVRTCLRKYATFSGRARRSEYWYFMIFASLVEALAAVVFSNIFPATVTIDGTSFSLITLAVSLFLTLPRLAVTVRRLHDIGKSGWALCINFIPVIGQIIFFIWCLRDSEPRFNRFGPDPKRFPMAMLFQNA